MSPEDAYWAAHRRANAARAAGRPAEAGAIEAQARRDAQLERLFQGAKLAGRAREFDEAYRRAIRRRRALGLAAYVGEEEVLRELEPFAASSEAWLRRTYSDLSPQEAQEKAEANRLISAGEVKDRLDALLNAGLEHKEGAGDSTKKKRLWIDTTKDPGRVNPLARTEAGFGRLQRHATNPVGRGFARLRKALGGTPSERSTKSNSQAALEKAVEAQERRELAKLRKKNLRRLGQEHGLSGTSEGAIERSLRELGIEIVTPQMQDEARRRAHTIAQQAHRRSGSFLRPRQSLSAAYRKGGWKGAIVALPKSWFLLLGFGIVSMVLTMGNVLGVALLQAASVALANGLSMILAALNGFLAFAFGITGTGANFVFGILSGPTGFVYDTVWASIGRHVPHAEYTKPVLGLTSIAFPQVAYIGSMLTVDVHDNGDVDYGFPTWVPVDATGNEVGSWVVWKGEFSIPDLSRSVIRCNGEAHCEKSSLALMLEDVGADLACRVRQTVDREYDCSRSEPA